MPRPSRSPTSTARSITLQICPPEWHSRLADFIVDGLVQPDMDQRGPNRPFGCRAYRIISGNGEASFPSGTEDASRICQPLLPRCLAKAAHTGLSRPRFRCDTKRRTVRSWPAFDLGQRLLQRERVERCPTQYLRHCRSMSWHNNRRRGVSPKVPIGGISLLSGWLPP